MNPQKFGDSYDIVKKEIIHGLACPSEWAVHPMYFAQFRRQHFVKQYAEFLGINVAQGDIYRKGRRFREIGMACGNHLFLDPDTGLKMAGQISNKRLVVEDLVQIATAPNRRHRLTLVYDQTYNRDYPAFGDLEQQVRDKLGAIRNFNDDVELFGAAYISHAVFIWVSADQDTVVAATNRLIACSRLPRWRFVGDGV